MSLMRFPRPFEFETPALGLVQLTLESLIDNLNNINTDSIVPSLFKSVIVPRVECNVVVNLTLKVFFMLRLTSTRRETKMSASYFATNQNWNVFHLSFRRTNHGSHKYWKQ